MLADNAIKEPVHVRGSTVLSLWFAPKILVIIGVNTFKDVNKVAPVKAGREERPEVLRRVPRREIEESSREER